MLPLLLSFPHGSNGRSKCTSHHFGMYIKKGMIGFEWESMDEGGASPSSMKRERR